MSITISVPGSKSISNRALMLAALTSGTTTLHNLADCDDTAYMIAGLKKLGIKIAQHGNTVKITGSTFKKSKKLIRIFTGNAGTSTRFLTALATLSGNKVRIDGDKRMRERPIKELVEALNKLGAKIDCPTGCPPLTIHPQKPTGAIIKISGNISSQYLSALLMIAPFTSQPTTINIEHKLCSKPYLNMTISLLKRFKIAILNKNFKQLKISPQKTKSPGTYTIEADASSASYIGAYAYLHPEKKIRIANIDKNSIQGDIKFMNYLEKLKATKKALGKIDMNDTPDLVMTFAILALFTPGTTKITNIANLRIKETDRIAALETELKKLGAKVKTTKDSIKITATPLNNHNKKIIIETYKDHRIAMCFGIIQDFFPSMKIKNPNCVSKSYKTFWKDLSKLRNV